MRNLRRCEACGREKYIFKLCRFCDEKRYLRSCTIENIKNYTGVFYDEKTNSCYSNLEQLREHYDNEYEMPFYLYCAIPLLLYIDVEDVVNSTLENMDIIHEIEFKDLKYCDELVEFVDAWCRKQYLNKFATNFKRIVVLDKKRFDDFINIKLEG